MSETTTEWTIAYDRRIITTLSAYGPGALARVQHEALVDEAAGGDGACNY